MNLYFTNRVHSVYFYENTVTFALDVPISKSSTGLSFITKWICDGIDDIDMLTNKLALEFNLSDNTEEVKNMILSSTIYEQSLKDVFTFNVKEANLSPKINGILGRRYPQIVHVELTGTCNFECSHCYKNATHNGDYIDYELLHDKIYNRLKGIVPAIHFTGGEPTLHKHFADIVDLFCQDYIIQLSTNGSRIVYYPIDLFKKFQAIDVSLYGLSPDEYQINTGNANAFENVKQGCMNLKAASINYRVTVVLNNNNWIQMEDYIKYAIDVGAKNISFSVPMISGKNLSPSSDKWVISADTRKMIYKKLRWLQNTYKDIISIKDWTRNNYSDMWKFYPLDDSLRCGAGKGDWWMSEKFSFRPCSFLPNEYLNIDYQTWHEYLLCESEIDWKGAKTSLELFAQKNNLSLTDICPIFRKEG